MLRHLTALTSLVATSAFAIGARSSFSRSACRSLVVGLSCALAACETMSYGRIVVEAAATVDPTCIDRAAEFVNLEDRFDRLPQQQGAVEFAVKRGIAAVGVHIYEDTITMSFGWHGRESRDVEQAAVRLLDDVRRAVIRSCDIQRPPAKITTTCSIRDCEKLLRTAVSPGEPGANATPSPPPQFPQ